MAHSIFVGETGNPVTYNLSGAQSFAVESLNADVDTNAIAPATETACDVIYRDNAGLLIARTRSSFTLQQGGVVSITFAPNLPDTNELNNNLAGFTNTTGLCATTLPPGGSVTVQPVDPLAIVKGFRMWVDSAVDEQGEAEREEAKFGRWALVPGPGA